MFTSNDNLDRTYLKPKFLTLKDWILYGSAGIPVYLLLWISELVASQSPNGSVPVDAIHEIVADYPNLHEHKENSGTIGKDIIFGIMALGILLILGDIISYLIYGE